MWWHDALFDWQAQAWCDAMMIGVITAGAVLKWVLGVCVVAGVGLGAQALTRRGVSRSLAFTKDGEFLESDLLKDLPSALVLEERRWLARKLGVPHERLAPDLSLGALGELARLPFGPLAIALGDLELELSERYPNEQTPALDGALTVGTLVAWLAARRVDGLKV